MSLFEIKHRFNGSVSFSLECGSLKLCVEAAVKASADLTSADLRSADLTSADLRSADLTYANLTSANLRSANLTYANLTYANLTSADLRYADLRYANLTSANLTSADLTSADLTYAKWPRDAAVLNAPIQISGLQWPVLIFGSHMLVGCETHSLREWEDFGDEIIGHMDSNALEFWRTNKSRLLAFRDAEAEQQFAEKETTDAVTPTESPDTAGAAAT